MAAIPTALLIIAMTIAIFCLVILTCFRCVKDNYRIWYKFVYKIRHCCGRIKVSQDDFEDEDIDKCDMDKKYYKRKLDLLRKQQLASYKHSADSYFGRTSTEGGTNVEAVSSEILEPKDKSSDLLLQSQSDIAVHTKQKAVPRVQATIREKSRQIPKYTGSQIVKIVHELEKINKNETGFELSAPAKDLITAFGTKERSPLLPLLNKKKDEAEQQNTIPKMSRRPFTPDLLTNLATMSVKRLSPKIENDDMKMLQSISPETKQFSTATSERQHLAYIQEKGEEYINDKKCDVSKQSTTFEDKQKNIVTLIPEENLNDITEHIPDTDNDHHEKYEQINGKAVKKQKKKRKASPSKTSKKKISPTTVEHIHDTNKDHSSKYEQPAVSEAQGQIDDKAVKNRKRKRKTSPKTEQTAEYSYHKDHNKDECRNSSKVPKNRKNESHAPIEVISVENLENHKQIQNLPRAQGSEKHESHDLTCAVDNKKPIKKKQHSLKPFTSKKQDVHVPEDMYEHDINDKGQSPRAFRSKNWDGQESHEHTIKEDIPQITKTKQKSPVVHKFKMHDDQMNQLTGNEDVQIEKKHKKLPKAHRLKKHNRQESHEVTVTEDWKEDVPEQIKIEIKLLSPETCESKKYDQDYCDATVTKERRKQIINKQSTQETYECNTYDGEEKSEGQVGYNQLSPNISAHEKELGLASLDMISDELQEHTGQLASKVLENQDFESSAKDTKRNDLHECTKHKHFTHKRHQTKKHDADESSHPKSETDDHIKQKKHKEHDINKSPEQKIKCNQSSPETFGHHRKTARKKEHSPERYAVISSISSDAYNASVESLATELRTAQISRKVKRKIMKAPRHGALYESDTDNSN